MKNLKRLLVLVLCLFINVVIVHAEDFVPHASLGSFDGEYLTINLWYGGASVSEIEHTIKYDYNYLEVYSISGDTFSSNLSNIESKNNYKIDKLYAVTMNDNSNATYANVTFKVKDAFSVRKTMYLTFEDVVGISSDKKRYKSEPLVVTVRRDSTNTVYFYQEYLTKDIEKQIWLNDHFLNIVVIIVTVIVILALFLIAPTNFVNRKKTSKSLKKKINKKPKKASIQNFDLNPDKISEIGKKKKAEPRNKIELGDYNPLAKNKGKRN